MNNVYEKDNLKDKLGNELQDFRTKDTLNCRRATSPNVKESCKNILIDYDLTIQIDKS